MIDSGEPGFADITTLRSVDFDWAASLQDVWKDHPYDVPQLHARTRREFREKLNQMGAHTAQGESKSPLGWVLMGAGGSGKTHLLGAMRAATVEQSGAFVLVDMTDVRDFWETTLHGYLDSLHAEDQQQQRQHHRLMRQIVSLVSSEGFADHNLRVLHGRRGEDLHRDFERLLGSFSGARRESALLHQDALRALICLNSLDFAAANAGLAWMQGQELDEDLQRALGFRREREEPKQIIRSLSWWMGLSGPTITAFDQLDSIVHQLTPLTRAAEQPWEQRAAATARGIVEQIGGGLSALRDVACNTLVVVSCVESTWALLNQHVLNTYRDRFEEPIRLGRPTESEVFESLIRNRLEPAYARRQQRLPYPTWPFHEQAILQITSETPREVLKLCDAHRRACVISGRVTEVRCFADIGRASPPAASVDELARWDRAYDRLRDEAKLEELLAEDNEDAGLGRLLQDVLTSWMLEQAGSSPLAESCELETEFGGGVGGRPPLHARLRCSHPEQPQREQHVSFRALQKTHHAAFQTRLKAAMTHAGIDPGLHFRSLIIVRTLPAPSGAATAALVDTLRSAGGELYRPLEQELRSWVALQTLLHGETPAPQAWLEQRHVVSALPLGQRLQTLLRPTLANP